jgi:uncharacterized protein (DUF427 family)
VGTYPESLTPAGHVAPVPRRIRAWLGGRCVLETSRAYYVWEWPGYPQYYVPVDDVAPGLLADEGVTEDRVPGAGHRHRVGERGGTAWVHRDGDLAGHVRFEWSALDAWFEEDEQVFVHPRSPYSRVDALRSGRRVRVELAGEVLAESSSPVLVFETGLPTRHYLPRTDVRWEHLEPSGTVTECPYKGRTTGYWSVRAGGELHPDLAWSYDFPTRQLLPIAGLVAFYDEKVDTSVDGVPVERPVTHFS